MSGRSGSDDSDMDFDENTLQLHYIISQNNINEKDVRKMIKDEENYLTTFY